MFYQRKEIKMNDNRPEPNVSAGSLLGWSIAAALLCGIATPFLWIASNKAIRTLEEAGFEQGGQHGLAKAAQIVSIVGMCFWILGMIGQTQLRSKYGG
jgi:hypothetical protein